MTNSATFSLINKLSELEWLMSSIAQWCQQRTLAEDTIHEISLIADEVVSNIIRHGFAEAGEQTIRFAIALDHQDVVMTVEDEGLQFNPLLLPPPDITRPIEERKPGGLGIFMVRKMTEDIQYQREGETNRLILRKRVVFDS